MTSKNWSHALLERAIKSSNNSDPYKNLDFWKVESSDERVIVSNYDPVLDKWMLSDHIVRMESRPFAKGSMRSCYRVKKLSNFVDNPTWENASAYVAKCYTNTPPDNPDFNRNMVQIDVKVQMMAKRYAELFNASNPPKKIDVMQVMMFEFVDREGSPCFCVERFLTGEYIKYNSNVGFADEHRNTPQAFSHFSFECSKGQNLIVDIQGVGDLYTDPQIHALDESALGEGNLGLSGYALFFHTHQCNTICRHLDLKPFDHYPYLKTLSELEKQDLDPSKSGSGEIIPSITKTHWKPHSKMAALNRNVNGGPVLFSTFAPTNPQMTLVQIDSMIKQLSNGHEWIVELRKARDILEPIANKWNFRSRHKSREKSLQLQMENINADNNPLVLSPQNNNDDSHELKNNGNNDLHMNRIIGMIHRRIGQHFMANDIPFSVPTSASEVASIVLFHYQQAVHHENVEAALVLSNLYNDMPCDEISIVKLVEKDIHLSIVYAEKAAKMGSRVGLLKVASMYDSIRNPVCQDATDSRRKLPEWHNLRFKKAYDAYENAIKMDFWPSFDVESRSFELTYERHDIYACMASLLETGGHGLEMDVIKSIEMWQQAADTAEMSFKAKKALYYYEQINRLTS